MPVSPSSCTFDDVTVQPSDSVILQPGRYCGGLKISGTAHFEPGIYIIADGDLEITSQATVTGDEVTFGLTGATPTSVGNVMINGGGEQIGRASCRERGCRSVYVSVVAESLQKKDIIK